jgi:transposase-like protein
MKLGDMTWALGIGNISASQVSEINKGLQEQVDGFRSRPLEECHRACNNSPLWATKNNPPL